MHEPNFMLVYEVHLGLQIVAFSIIYWKIKWFSVK
jgi:hypothetical protein